MFYDARQRLEAHRSTLSVANDIFIGEGEVRPSRELNRFWVDFTEPHFWPRKVGHDRDAAAGLLRNITKTTNHFAMPGEIAVREIQTGNIKTRSNSRAEY